VLRAFRPISRSTAKSYSFVISILCLIAIIAKVLSDLRRNLMVRHLVNGFHTHDASTEVGSFEPLFQLPLGLTRAECPFCRTPVTSRAVRRLSENGGHRSRG